MITQTFQYGADGDGKDLSIVASNINVVYSTVTSSPEDRLLASRRQQIVGRLFGRDPEIAIEAVKNVSFMAYKGDSIGFLGINGAGKSSLLRVISGNESPKSGYVYATSQPALLGVSAALLPDLSGYENARLGCLGMGLTPEETEEALPDIVSFTSIGNAIYRPMRSYSSGMGARLRFAISTVMNPEILIIDEALSTGDASFQDKSKTRMESMLDGSGTILLVSHSATQVEGMCNRAIWMHYGEIIADGGVEEVTEFYRVWARHLRTDKAKAAEYMEDVRAAYIPLDISVTGTEGLMRIRAKEL